MPGYRVRALPGQIEPPFDLAYLINWLGLVTEYRELPQGVSGVYIAAKRPHIVLNSKERPERHRWTTAHELGHYLLGIAGIEKRGGLLSRDGDTEKACDRLACELLMPHHVVRRMVAKVGHGTFDRTALLADLFGVSRLAMLIRLKELGL